VVTFPSVVVDFSALSNKAALIYCPTPAIHCTLFWEKVFRPYPPKRQAPASTQSSQISLSAPDAVCF
jgi:hypothetical protein